mmetsp:Transcript_3090/g.10540  ORF Transcript_3090/g.10540 Transcript_3090/m.10540 type:complete len:216 (-) Transcript_3090:748-1395(-)
MSPKNKLKSAAFRICDSCDEYTSCLETVYEVVLGPTAERLVSLPSRECEGEEFANGGIGTAVVPLPLLLVPTTFLPQNDLNWFLNPFLVLKIIAFNPYNNRSMCGAMTLSVNLLMKAFNTIFSNSLSLKFIVNALTFCSENFRLTSISARSCVSFLALNISTSLSSMGCNLLVFPSPPPSFASCKTTKCRTTSTSALCLTKHGAFCIVSRNINSN